MNKVHSIIWSVSSQCWVVVAEGTRRRCKATSRRVLSLAAATLLNVGTAQAVTLPQGGQVTLGQGTISQDSPTSLTVTQTTDKLSVNWQSFSIGEDAAVNFVQPDSHSVALNRVVGRDASAILGRLTANGQVFLINPNGVLIGINCPFSLSPGRFCKKRRFCKIKSLAVYPHALYEVAFSVFSVFDTHAGQRRTNWLAW